MPQSALCRHTASTVKSTPLCSVHNCLILFSLIMFFLFFSSFGQEPWILYLVFADNMSDHVFRWLSSGITKNYLTLFALKVLQYHAATIENQSNKMRVHCCIRWGQREVGYTLSLRISLRWTFAQRQVTASASQLVTIHALLSQSEKGSTLLAVRDTMSEGVIAVKQCVREQYQLSNYLEPGWATITGCDFSSLLVCR